MIGYHSVPVIADAFAKGTTDADLDKALEACVATSNVNYFNGLGEYIKNGYVSEEGSPYSVSLTLEYAYDDWCIAQLAQKAGNVITSYSIHYTKLYEMAESVFPAM